MNINYAYRAGAFAGSLKSLLYEPEMYHLLDGDLEKISKFEKLIKSKLKFAEDISVEREQLEANS